MTWELLVKVTWNFGTKKIQQTNWCFPPVVSAVSMPGLVGGILSAHEMWVSVACCFLNGRFHGTMILRMQVAVISDVCFSYYSLRLEAIVAFLAEEMADGRHGVFDGQLLRWSDGSTWRRVDEQSGVHQAILRESTAKKIIVELPFSK